MKKPIPSQPQPNPFAQLCAQSQPSGAAKPSKPKALAVRVAPSGAAAPDAEQVAEQRSRQEEQRRVMNCLRRVAAAAHLGGDALRAECGRVARDEAVQARPDVLAALEELQADPDPLTWDGWGRPPFQLPHPFREGCTIAIDPAGAPKPWDAATPEEEREILAIYMDHHPGDDDGPRERPAPGMVSLVDPDGWRDAWLELQRRRAAPDAHAAPEGRMAEMDKLPALPPASPERRPLAELVSDESFPRLAENTDRTILAVLNNAPAGTQLSVSAIAKACNCKRETAKRHLEELSQRGWVRRTRVAGGGGNDDGARWELGMRAYRRRIGQGAR